jgi:uncharacterized membrane protein YdjX (TVP38/TMEM64 family)
MNRTKRAVAKFAVLVLILLFIGIIYRLPVVQKSVSQEQVSRYVQGFGILGPLFLTLLITIGEMSPVPSVIFIILTAVLLGPMPAFVCATIGTNIGSFFSFWIARRLGREYVGRVIGKKLARYDAALTRHGFTTSLYLRLTFLPSAIVNYGSGLTRMRFKDYFWGTVIGHIPQQLFLIFVVSRIITGEYGTLLGWQAILSLLLFGIAFFIPVLARKATVGKKLVSKK